jgi:hypothetical protein
MAGDAVIDLVLEDQMGRRRATADLRGRVAVLVHGDRGCADEARRFGVAVNALVDGTSPHARSPIVIPVASIPGVPVILRGTVRAAVKAAAGEFVVWLDFWGRVRDRFDLATGIPAAIILDATGRLGCLRRGPFAPEAVADVAALARSLAAGQPAGDAPG